jgi:hypothetical protein
MLLPILQTTKSRFKTYLPTKIPSHFGPVPIAEAVRSSVIFEGGKEFKS